MTVVGLVLLAAASTLSPPEFQLIGSESYFAAPFDVSADGTVIAGYANHNDQQGYFRWSKETGFEFKWPQFRMRSIQDDALALSADGSAMAAMTNLGVVYCRGDDVRVIAKDAQSLAGITPDGKQVVLNLKSDDSHIYRWTEQTGLVAIEAPKSKALTLTGLSADGAVVVGFRSTKDAFHPVIWRDGKFDVLMQSGHGMTGRMSGDGRRFLARQMVWEDDQPSPPIPGESGFVIERFSQDGSILGGMRDSACLWTKETGVIALAVLLERILPKEIDRLIDVKGLTVVGNHVVVVGSAKTTDGRRRGYRAEFDRSILSQAQ